MSLGKRLKEARESKGWTQLHAAKLLNVPNQNLSNYERDFRSPDPTTLRKLSELYEVTSDWLIGTSSKPHLTEQQERELSLNTLRETAEKLSRGEYIDVPKDEQSQMADFIRWRIQLIEEKLKAQK